MYLIRKYSLTLTTQNLATALNDSTPEDGPNLLWQAAAWVGHQIHRVMAALYRVLRIQDMLNFIGWILLQAFKWLAIVLAILISVPIAIWVLYFIIHSLWKVYSQGQTSRYESWNTRGSIVWQAASRTTRQQKLAAQQAALAEHQRGRLRDQEDRLAQDKRKRATEQWMAAREATLAEERRRRRRATEDRAAQNKLKRDEAERKAAQEERMVNERQKRDEEQRKKDFIQWEAECVDVFGDMAAVTKFPFPPLPRCSTPSCAEFSKTYPCEHNVKQFFEGSGTLSLKLLKKHRSLWHEDRFAGCKEEVRVEFKGLANSLFVALYPMYEKFKAREQI